MEVVHHFYPFFKVYSDGRVERFFPAVRVPPSDDPKTGVRSKDVTISTSPPVSARVFIPPIPDSDRRLPVLVYIHGGGFSVCSAFMAMYHDYVSSVSAAAGVISVSIEYRLAPENPLPACYDDSWAAMEWIGAHAGGLGPEPWLNDHADLSRVYLAGDSAGGNISHNMVVRARLKRLEGVRVVGLVLVHPFFGADEEDKLWTFICPDSTGTDDPRLRPAAEDLANLKCDKVLVFVAQKDHLKDRGVSYCQELKKSGWKGRLEMVEHEDEGHVFHLLKPGRDKAADLMQKLVAFLND